MFGIRFIKVQPTTYLFLYKDDKLLREGTGLSFFYYAPTASLVAVPLAAGEAPFIFEEVTSDFQEITIQGQVTYRITNPEKVSKLLDFSLDARTRMHASDDPEKLPQRVINLVKVLTRAELRGLLLKEALRASDDLSRKVMDGLMGSTEIMALGIEILGLSILAIKPNPETARALEAQARERLLREADEAIYARRNSAVEQERSIRENELNTEIAVENKKRQIEEAKMDAKRAVQEKEHELREAEMVFRTLLEEKKRQLTALSVQNMKDEAEAKAYGIAVAMKALEKVDAKVIQALAGVGMQPDQLVAMAFQGLAERAEKIGELNVSPELLSRLLKT
ncbi:MAG: SPFH domain-containing protein [Pseudomonadota bacterium]